MKIKLLNFCIVGFLLIQLNSFHLHAQVVANFSSTPLSGCAPLSVSFSDLSTGSPTSWSWNFGNSNTSSTKNPSAVYSNPGTYTVTLVAAKSGSSSTKTSTIIVYANPTANFTTSTTPSCVGQTVTFTNTSIPGSGTINSWKWDFGDGNVQPIGSAITTHIYSSSGTFPVSLIITDNDGCTNSIVKNISIISAPVAAFTGSPLTSCAAPLTVNFTNSSTGIGLTYLWDFGDGPPNSTATNPSRMYTIPGAYTVKLIITQGGCKDSIVKTNYITIQDIAADFSANVTSACAGSTISFTDLSVPVSTNRIWDFGDGSPTSTAPNPAHTYTAPGTYTVSLLNASVNGCSDSEIKTAYITIHPIPVAAFTANSTQACSIPFPVNFTDNSTFASGWVWDFGDGSPTSSLQNPSHTYTALGSYSVSLIVTSVNGCVDTIIQPNYIFISRPIAGFEATPREGCIPLTVNFTDTSSSLVDPIVSYNWDFGNGTGTTASPTISHLYAAPGIYTVNLIVTTSSGCNDTVTINNYVKAGTPPTANFNIVDSIICYGASAQFNDLSVNADSAFWQYGDATILPTLRPNSPVLHYYSDTGTYTVTLIVYNNGCADTSEQQDIVKILSPKPEFSLQLNCINPYSVDFTDASNGADSISWDFGDGSPIVSDSLMLTHVYATRGIKTVTITAYNFTTGCSFSYAGSFTIADLIGQYTAGPNSGCYPLPVTFTNTSQDGIDSVLWNFDDGSLDTTTSVFFTPVHTYALPGLYKAKLLLRDVNGCKDSIRNDIIVQGVIPNFIADTLMGCAPLPIVFTDSTVSDSALVQWNWTFGDLTSQTSFTPTINHTYTSAGFYSVKLVVMDKNGCADSITKINYILPTFPIPKFVALADTFACRNETVSFNASSTIVATPATYTWNFGDGVSAIGLTTDTITHAYTSDSTYIVTLIVTDKNGCVDSIKHPIFVQEPIADFKDSTGTEACSFKDVYFTDKSTGTAITNWQWNFGDGATSISQNPQHVYTVPGIYSVSLIVTNIAGCTNTITYSNLIVVPGAIGTFSFTPQTGCNPLTVTFTAVSANATEYVWDFGDGSPLITTTTSTVQYTYTKDITATPQLLLGNILTNGSPCHLPAPSAGQVTVTTTVGVNIDSSSIQLEEGEFFIINSSITGATGTPTYSWSPPDGLNCIDCPAPSTKADGSGNTVTYYLTVTDQGGCIGSDSIKFIFTVCIEDPVIPNVFTPNGDGINDAFDIKGICAKNNYIIRIYDRWGIALFASKERNFSWDGRSATGQLIPEGVYYYILTLEDKSYTGFLHLIR